MIYYNSERDINCISNLFILGGFIIMKLAVKVLKVVFSMGLIYLAGEYYGKSVAEVYLELTDPKRK
jgi:hypothetical protein